MNRPLVQRGTGDREKANSLFTSQATFSLEVAFFLILTLLLL